MNATRHDGFDQGAHILVFDSPLVLVKTGCIDAERHRLILQVALATLIANRTIKRMVDQEKLHHPLACPLYRRCFGMHDHTLTHWQRTACHRLRRLFDLDQTHTAIARNGKAFVVTKPRYVRACFFARLQNSCPVLDFHFDAIDCEFWHGPTPPLLAQPVPLYGMQYALQ